MVYITNPYIDDICEKGEIVSIKSCNNCKYCKEISKVIRAGGRLNNTIVIRVDCNYENN